MTETAQLVRVEATYPWFGDGEPWVWMTNRLQKATDAGQITDFKVLSAKPPLSVSDKLMDIKFTVDVQMPRENPRRDHVRYFLNILNGIVHDTDVEIHTVEPIK